MRERAGGGLGEGGGGRDEAHIETETAAGYANSSRLLFLSWAPSEMQTLLLLIPINPPLSQVLLTSLKGPTVVKKRKYHRCG